jgi:hypothetical protein
MKEYYQGAIDSVFCLGNIVESSKEIYETELKRIEGAKVALDVVLKQCEAYIANVKKDIELSNVSLKEGEYAIKHVNNVRAIVQQICLEAEKKSIATSSSIESFIIVIEHAKKLWEDGKTKLNSIDERSKDDHSASSVSTKQRARRANYKANEDK